MTKEFTCTQLIETLHETSIIVEGNSEEECKQKLMEFLNGKINGSVHNRLIDSYCDTQEGIEIIDIGVDKDSYWGTTNIIVHDENFDEVFENQ